MRVTPTSAPGVTPSLLPTATATLTACPSATASSTPTLTATLTATPLYPFDTPTPELFTPAPDLCQVVVTATNGLKLRVYAPDGPLVRVMAHGERVWAFCRGESDLSAWLCIQDAGGGRGWAHSGWLDLVPNQNVDCSWLPQFDPDPATWR